MNVTPLPRFGAVLAYERQENAEQYARSLRKANQPVTMLGINSQTYLVGDGSDAIVLAAQAKLLQQRFKEPLEKRNPDKLQLRWDAVDAFRRFLEAHNINLHNLNTSTVEIISDATQSRRTPR